MGCLLPLNSSSDTLGRDEIKYSLSHGPHISGHIELVDGTTHVVLVDTATFRVFVKSFICVLLVNPRRLRQLQ